MRSGGSLAGYIARPVRAEGVGGPGRWEGRPGSGRPGSGVGRRAFLRTAVAGGVWAAGARIASAAEGRRPRLVLRSSWQTVNIGDIGHTPGVLALFERHLPEVDVTLWPMDVGNGVEEMLRRRFPKLRIV